MPSIISAPVRTRTNNRGITETFYNEHMDLMEDTMGTDQVVVVDESETNKYDKSYVRAERIRLYARKIKDPRAENIKVIAFQVEEGKFVGAISWKDES